MANDKSKTHKGSGPDLEGERERSRVNKEAAARVIRKTAKEEKWKEGPGDVLGALGLE